MAKLLFIFCLVCVFFAKGQPGKEAWHWYFGDKAKIDFSSGVAVGGLGIPAEYAGSQCASISDANTGQYLFSFGGTKIFNKTNAVMANGYGILANTYSSQAVIVPRPGNSNIYYVITSNHSSGIYYCVVDMTLQSGLGQVTVKNKLLTPPPTTEKVTAVKHCNGTDYWVITHPANSNAFNAYLITATGLDTIPVVSNVGTVHQFLHYVNPFYLEGIGQLKFSPNAKKLASSIQSDSIPVLDILDFDNSTGVVSNPITINYPGILGPYGVSFSPDNSKLYAIPYNRWVLYAQDSARIYQYDMSSGVPANIVASQTLIFTGYKSYELGGMQVAPDGKIYIARYGSDTLAIINNPNALGLTCNFLFNGIVLTGAGVYGFNNVPNFIDANYAGIQINLPDIKQCSLKPDTIDAGSGFTNYFWNTGASTQTITINNPGKYWVTVTNAQGCTRTDTMEAVLISPGKKVISACVMDTVSTIQSSALTYNWSDGDTLPVKTFSVSGTYWEDISFIGGCAVRDSFDITINPLPVVNLGRDTTFCKGDLLLNAQNPNSTYLWSTGETTSSITAKAAGTYWIKVNENNCLAYDTLIVKPELSLFDFVMPNIVTPNDDKINDEIDFSKYQFSTFQIQIFNRWGLEIFKSEDPDVIWKPTQDDGTYFYTAQYKIDCGADSRSKNLKGFITIVR